MTTQAGLHRTANTLERIAKLLHDHGQEAFDLAAKWSGHGAAVAAIQPGSRGTGPNDVGERLVKGGDVHGNATNGFDPSLKADPAYIDAHTRMVTFLRRLEHLDPQRFLDDLTYCRRTVVAQGNDAIRLARQNSKDGECETCYTAGRVDSYQRGTLEHIDLERTTMSEDPDRHDLCRNCAKSAHGSRADARSRGEDWDYDTWSQQRIERLATTPAA